MGLEQKPEPVSAFRRLLPQCLACAAKNLLILDLAMAISVPTIVIPALTGVRNRDADEFLSLNPFQASWFGKFDVFRLFVKFNGS